MLNILKYLYLATLILVDIACIVCSFKCKPVYPYVFWFIITSIAIICCF